jgi:hypothetical protein
MKQLFTCLFLLLASHLISQSCVQGGTIMATYNTSVTLSCPPGFVSSLHFEICNPGVVYDSCGGTHSRVFYIGSGGELNIKASTSFYVVMKNLARCNVLSGANFVQFLHEPGAVITGAAPGSATLCAPIGFPNPNQCGAVGISELDTERSLSFYPNPASDKLVIENFFPANLDLKLINAYGIEIRTVQLTGGKQEVDVGELPAGVYYLSADRAAMKYHKKLVIIN